LAGFDRLEFKLRCGFSLFSICELFKLKSSRTRRNRHRNNFQTKYQPKQIKVKLVGTRIAQTLAKRYEEKDEENGANNKQKLQY